MPIKKPCAIINAKSGSTTDITAALKAKLVEKYGNVGPVEYLDPAKMVDHVEAAISDGCDLVIIYGGDGTALTAAKIATAKNIPIVALPGGTMNMLPKALYGTEDWEDALDTALSCEAPRWMPAGLFAEQMFLCGCLIGTPARLNDVREQMRDFHLIEAAQDLVMNLMNFDAEDTFEYSTEETDGSYNDANLLNIICPQTSELDTGKTQFEVNAIDVDGIADIASLGWAGLTSDWREGQSAQTQLSDTVYLRGSGSVDVLLDGEAVRADLPVKITLREKGVLVLAP